MNPDIYYLKPANIDIWWVTTLAILTSSILVHCCLYITSRTHCKILVFIARKLV